LIPEIKAKTFLLEGDHLFFLVVVGELVARTAVV